MLKVALTFLMTRLVVRQGQVIQLPTASPATVLGLWVISLLDVRWDNVGGLSGARWGQFEASWGRWWGLL
eukprot:7102851-Pyramimonas_sp.AAC.1